MHPFLQQSLSFSQDLTKYFHGFPRRVVISDIVCEYDNPKYNPSPVQELG